MNGSLSADDADSADEERHSPRHDAPLLTKEGLGEVLIQSAINVSEGRREDVIRAVLDAARDVEGVGVADWSADADHNRMVVTLLGVPEGVRAAALRIARKAVELIDLRDHSGAHPRIGAVDVIPLVPIRGVTMADCISLSHRIGENLGRELELPVYLYERSARPGRRAALPEIRAGGFEGLLGKPLEGDLAPDYGPGVAHPTAGAVVLGARGPLVACNVNLDSSDVAAARRIAGRIRRERRSNPALSGVRALGILLPSRQTAQVSMNLTLPEVTTLPTIFDYIREAAEHEHVAASGSEVVGLIPRAALGGEPPERICWKDYRETQILEYWTQPESG